MTDKIDKLKLKLDQLFKKISSLENENKRLLKKTNTLSQLNIDLGTFIRSGHWASTTCISS